MERKFHGSESSLYGLFALRNESAEERKGLELDRRLASSPGCVLRFAQCATLCCYCQNTIYKMNKVYVVLGV